MMKKQYNDDDLARDLQIAQRQMNEGKHENADTTMQRVIENMEGRPWVEGLPNPIIIDVNNN